MRWRHISVHRGPWHLLHLRHSKSIAWPWMLLVIRLLMVHHDWILGGAPHNRLLNFDLDLLMFINEFPQEGFELLFFLSWTVEFVDNWLQSGLYLLYILVLTILSEAGNQLVNVYVVVRISVEVLLSFHHWVSRLYQIYLNYLFRWLKTRLFTSDRAELLGLLFFWIWSLHFFHNDLFSMLNHYWVPEATRTSKRLDYSLLTRGKSSALSRTKRTSTLLLGLNHKQRLSSQNVHWSNVALP